MPLDENEDDKQQTKVFEICDAIIERCHKKLFLTLSDYSVADLKQMITVVREAWYLKNYQDASIAFGAMEKLQGIGDEGDEDENDDEDEDEEGSGRGPFDE